MLCLIGTSYRPSFTRCRGVLTSAGTARFLHRETVFGDARIRSVGRVVDSHQYRTNRALSGCANPDAARRCKTSLRQVRGTTLRCAGSTRYTHEHRARQKARVSEGERCGTSGTVESSWPGVCPGIYQPRGRSRRFSLDASSSRVPSQVRPPPFEGAGVAEVTQAGAEMAMAVR